MKGKLKNRNALITGASRGIGLAIAARFAEEGANLSICARDVALLEEKGEQLRQFGVKIITHSADVSDRGSVQEMVQKTLKEFGQIDILVNNAGGVVSKRAKFVEYSLDDFDKIIKVNLYGVVHVSQAVLPGMIERRKGKVINIASTAGKWGSRNQSAYNAAKHAVVGLTRCIALELGPYNINVNAICPGLTETRRAEILFQQQSKIMGISREEIEKNVLSQIPLGRLIQPSEVAHLALYLASDDSDGITAQSISLCGGYIMV